MRGLLLLGFLALGLALLPACGGDCPSGGQAGNCDFSNTAADPSMDVKPLTLEQGCDYVPIDVCSGSPGFTCSLGGGDQHRQGYAVIADQAGWDKLAASWSDPGLCTPAGLPTDWTDTYVVLASVRATSSTASTASYSLHRRSDGTPHIKIEIGMTYEDCDCAEEESVGLLVKHKSPPVVCLQVSSICN